VKYEQFIASVAERAGLPREEAEALTHATLRVLAERLTGGEAEDLRAQMPKELKADLIPPQEEALSFDVDEFARRVAQRTGTSEADAGAGVIAVLDTIHDAVTPGEFDDVLAQLGRDFKELVEATT
jgi:uncharacterized protein (DUF2267 family)